MIWPTRDKGSLHHPWDRIPKQLGIKLQLDDALSFHRYYGARHPRAPVYLWLGLDDPDDVNSLWQMGYTQKPEVEHLPSDLVCFIKGPAGMARLNHTTTLWVTFLKDMVPAMQRWANSTDWEDEDGKECHLVRLLEQKWSAEHDLFEAGDRMEFFCDANGKAHLARKFREWNGDLDRLVHACYANMNYRTNPDHIRDYLEQILPDLL